MHGMRSNKKTRPSSRFAGTALIAWCMITTVAAQVDVQPGSAVLEVIVKFDDASEAGRLIDRYIDRNSQDLGELAEIGDQLHAATGFVLTPERVTSGRELVVGVPERPLMERVRDVVVERAEVSTAELVTAESENPRRAQVQLLVRFRQLSDEAELLANTSGEDAHDQRVQALANELCAPSGVPVRGVSKSQGELAVLVDRFAVLETVVAQLNGLDDVKYAQPNATVRILR